MCAYNWNNKSIDMKTNTAFGNTVGTEMNVYFKFVFM